MDAFWKLVVLAVLFATVWGVVLGWAGNAVFFRDTSDLLLSFLGWVALVVFILIGKFLEWRWLSYVGAVVAVYFAYDAIRRAHQFNERDWRLSLPVGIGKVVLSFIYVVTWIEAIGPGGKTAAQQRQNRATALMIIGLLSLLFVKLVNGEEVLARRGEAPTLE